MAQSSVALELYNLGDPIKRILLIAAGWVYREHCKHWSHPDHYSGTHETLDEAWSAYTNKVLLEQVWSEK